MLSLIRELCDTLDMGVLFITHDLGVVAELADRVAVMYGGQIVEKASVDELFASPIHPYSKGLMDCVPNPALGQKRFHTIPGSAPSPGQIPDGCKFAPRCLFATQECESGTPPVISVSSGRQASCHHPLTGEVA